ncbi:hypothetical protein [Pedobacter sp. SYSU D00535]|uniref:hypothetical protein n=1 Tax=Pedobacter sp. SYSU D00535 TaxID=2810308 RepID=UPI001A97567A|nr:hypothetical protein [Pedobacter sp. SYSU D00535]
MLASISWQEYLIAIVTIATAYYAVVIAAYFRTEAFALLKNSRHRGTPSRPPVQNDIMGKAKEDVLAKSLSADDIQFSLETETDYSQDQ